MDPQPQPNSAPQPAPRRARRTAAPRAGTERRLPPLLRRAWYGLNQAFRRRIAHLSLTPDQYTVLRNLQEAGATGLTQTQLTARMSSDPNTIASLVDRMETAELLRREVDATDRRARRLRLSPTGRRVFREAYALATVLQEEILEPLAPERRAEFLESLDRVADACRRVAERE